MQLVSALRYEFINENKNEKDGKNNSMLENELIKRCCESLELANSFYWFLKVECSVKGIY